MSVTMPKVTKPKLCKGCNLKRPSFGKPLSAFASHCKKCKDPGMVDVVNPKCFCGKKNPAFAFPGSRPKHCKECCEPGMENVLTPRCEACRTVTCLFGYRGGAATHCKSCSLPGMEDLKSKRCRVCKKTKPSYGVEKGKATHCSKCALKHMRNVVSPICVACTNFLATYRLPGQSLTHCSSCKLEGMTAVNRRMCEGCNEKIPSYGLPGGRATHCAGCKSEGMKYVIGPTCELCDTMPTYGLPGAAATRCVTCKTTHMIDVVHKDRCGSCSLPNRRLQQGTCTACRIARPRKEIRMRKAIQNAFPAAEWMFDHTPAGVSICADKRYRPDCWLELATHVIAVECDEEQHKDQQYSCELRRTAELLASCEGKPLALIRWNPDGFTQKGVHKEVAEKTRVQALLKEIKRLMDEPPAVLFHTKYMYYDDVRESEQLGLLRASFSDYLKAGV